MQYALPEKVKNTLSQITLSVNIRKLQVSSGKLLRLNRSIKWISVIPLQRTHVAHQLFLYDYYGVMC